MTVIYDEALAAEHVKQRQTKERNHQIICGVAYVATLSFFAIVAASVFGNIEIAPWLFWSVVPVGAVSLIYLLAVAAGHGEEDPAPDIVYYEKAKESRILSVNIERHDHGWHRNVPFVVLRTEDTNGLVEKSNLCVAKYQESTKHAEETFDVNKGIVYIPYGGHVAV